MISTIEFVTNSVYNIALFNGLNNEFFSVSNQWILIILCLSLLVIGGIAFKKVNLILNQLRDKNSYYSSIFEKNHSVMLLIDPEDGNIIDANKEACLFYGYSKEEIKRKKISDINGLAKNEVFERMEEVKKQQGKSFYFQHRLSSGEIRDVEVYCNPIIINGKEILCSIVHDITYRKIFENALHQSERKFRELFNNANDAILLHGVLEDNKLDNFIEVNDVACSMLGYTKEELIKMTPEDLMIVETKKLVDETILKLLNKGRHTYTTVLVTKGGKIIPVEINSHVYFMNDKKVLMSIARDISERENAERTRKEREKAIEYENLRTEFFSNISHEFKTPLNVILGSVQLVDLYLKNEMLEDRDNRVHKHVATTTQNCYRLVRLLNNLLDITKIDAGYFETHLQNENIVAIVENITLSVAEYIENKGIYLEFDTDVEERVMACDPDKIERIMLNLLSNAVKFTNIGGCIYVNIEDKESSVVITVKDTGIGIPEDKIDIIFDRFRQVDKSFSRGQEGSGIGLSIVKTLVEMHEGTIKVESKNEIGSEFIIELPVHVLSEQIKKHEKITEQSVVERISIEFSDIYS